VGLAVAASPAPPGRIPAIHLPRAAHRYKSRRRDPRRAPNPSRLGGVAPLSTHTFPPGKKGEQGGRRRRGAVRGSAVRREDRSRPWEEPDPPSPRTPTSPASPTSSTSRRRLRLPPRRRAAPPHYTDACTTARGHQGEDVRFPAHVDAPTFEPRWNAQSLRAAAPPLVMPAFVPSWDKLVCRCRCLRRRALAL
jgi:hypothetical protein